ncbi:MAG: hypothetical protein ACRD0J_12840 [Acidimicrobiales bacterium]
MSDPGLMMPEPPLPESFGLPPGTVVAVPGAGLEVFRLVRSDPPTRADFLPSPHHRRPEVPQLLRVGLSHYLSAGAAASYIRRPGSLVARVTLDSGLAAHVARTFTRTNPSHVTVWAAPELLVVRAVVVRLSG